MLAFGGIFEPHFMRDLLGTCFGLRWLVGGHVSLVLVSSALAMPGGSVTTTVYVGLHFEVRDHDQPTKYVFNGATRVAEITGSLSPNPRVQRLRLYPGWNLCSLAVSGPFPASGAEAISAAYQWNAARGDYSQIALGQTLTAGTVLWLKARTNAVVSVAGSYADPTVQQATVGNGFYLPSAGLEAWSPVLPDSASSWKFDAASAQWSQHLSGALAAISDPPPFLTPGEALYVEPAASDTFGIPDPSERIRYYHQDHLGSSSVITDAQGSLIDEKQFYPFGLVRNEYRLRQVETYYSFTQKERDRESGLHYFEARYLSGALSRFLNPDAKFASPELLAGKEFQAFLSSPQGLNLYSYVQNNSLKFADPTGLEGTALIIIGAGQETIKQQIKAGGGDPSDKALKEAVQGMFATQTKGMNVTVKFVSSAHEMAQLIRSGKWQAVAYFGHGVQNEKALDPGHGGDSLSKDELAEALKAANPKNVYLLGCVAGWTGLARDLSKELPNATVGASFEALDVDWQQGMDANKNRINRMSPNKPLTEYQGGFQMEKGKKAAQRRRERGDPIEVDPNAPISRDPDLAPVNQ